MSAERFREMGEIELPAGGALKCVQRDGAAVWKLRCPGCGEWADIDDDQFHGRVSLDHTMEFGASPFPEESDQPSGCSYHEIRDFASEIAAVVDA